MKMKEKQAVSKRTIVIDVKPTRGLVMALSCVLTGVALLAYLTLAGERAVASEAGTSGEASPAQSTGKRQFYLASGPYQGNATLTACGAGYHMASLWEIADPTNLEYDTSMGWAGGDTGSGPPSGVPAWVRTGYLANNSGGAGQANCSLWTALTGSGTTALLTQNWAVGDEDLGMWEVGDPSCGTAYPVWCIED